MEEISSLDSFHTDGADSTAKPDSLLAKLDEDTSQMSTDKPGNAATPSDPTDNKATSGNKSDRDVGDVEDEINNDEDFEQISDGTFEVDDNSQATSTGVGVVLVGDDKTPAVGDVETDAADGACDADEIDGTIERLEESVDTEESADFEEVDANLSAGTNAMAADESDMLGESDMTLPTDAAAAEEHGAGNKSSTAMEVDNDYDETEEQDNGSVAPVDVEMASISNSPEMDKHAPKSPTTEEATTTADLQGELMDAEDDHEEVEGDDGADSETNRNINIPLEKMAAPQGVEYEGDADADGIASGSKDTVDAEANEDAEEYVDAEHEDEPVENVQEPEESDVCLIPDDTETQMTDAEKEQAILARENAEKEDAEEQAEKDKEKEKEKDKAAEAAKVAQAEEEPSSTQATDENANAEAQATQAETDAAAAASDCGGGGGRSGVGVSEGTASDTVNDPGDTVDLDTDADAEHDAPEADGDADADADADADEPLLEEMQSIGGEQGAISKIIISWIVGVEETCHECEAVKTCGFRFKNPENSEQLEYVCDQSCCNTLLAANPGKYFIRRKKFLVEELSSEMKANATGVVEEDVADNDDDDDAVVPPPMQHECLHCKDLKVCAYFFKQDEDPYYICNDDCFNLLNAEEPDKFKLKRQSIRVRNIGTTSITTVPKSLMTMTAKKAGAAATVSAESRVVARTAAQAERARQERAASFTRRCADCFAEVVLGERNLLWETLDFCNEICLGKYQRTLGAHCQTCNGDVPHPALGKYCVRFGFEIRQFCCASCLNEFKKGLKTCSCCQKDISSGTEGFLAPVGDKEQFKDFCSQACMRRYDLMCNPKKKLRNDFCAVCNNDKPVRVEILLDDKEHTFCSNPCFSAFKFVSNIVSDHCGMCSKYFERKGDESFTIYTERRAIVFCSRICLNVYIIVNRRIVSCQWCKVKKYNFDMIYKQQDTQEILMCSLNCLTLYGVSINAFSRTVAKCDNCSNSATPQYHLTMSDASIRNFCTYQCVMQFQGQFARAPLTLDTDANAQEQQQRELRASTTTTTSSKATDGMGVAPFPTGLPKRVKLKVNQQQQLLQLKHASKNTTSVNKKGSSSSATNTGVLPVISTVSSLASGETETMIGSVTVRRGRGRGRKIDSPPPLATISTAANSGSSVGGTTTNTGSGRGRPRRTVDYGRSPSPPSSHAHSPPCTSSVAGHKRSVSAHSTQSSSQTETKIIAVPPYPPAVRNVQTSCRPQAVTVGFQTQSQSISVGVQTDKDYSNKVLIPVPVPIYVPQPMYMYSAPFPVPVPIPLPIPVPIFIPTTRNSAQGILKEIKKIQDKMPADPFEAELLMMAEMVAEEKRDSDSDSDDEIKPDPGVVAPNITATDTAMQYDASANRVQQQQQQQVEVSHSHNSYGEDMLQMALKMATGEYDQPTVDLESAMTANTISNPPPGMVGHDDSLSHMSATHHMQQQQHQQQEQHQMMDTQRDSTPSGGRGRKRGAVVSPVLPRNNRSPLKRQRMQDVLDVSPQPDVQQQQQVTMQTTLQVPSEKPDANMCLKYTFGVNAWKQWVMTKNADIDKGTIRKRSFKTELLQMTSDELNYSLCLFVKEVRKPNGTEYAPDTIYYLVLGIQQYLYENGRIDNIFTDPYYERFTDCLDEVARKFSVLYNDSQYIVTRVEEEHLWECKQLGAHSPHVLLSTLMFFNTKHFNLTTVEEHMQLSFSHIMKHWKRSAQNAKAPGTRNVLLRFYPPQAGLDANPRKKKVYEQQENEDNPLRCPVRLYEFYLSKCPESVKTRNDVFYLQPERSCVPDSPVWYSTQALSQDALQKMLHRVKMVKEINIALLTS